MKSIEVHRMLFDDEFPTLEAISERLDKIGYGHEINVLNWKEFDYKPEVRFNIAYSPREIFLKYYVDEKYLKAEMTETNQMVCEDSCVEFFVSPADDGIYYNIEFNAIGTCLLGAGTGRADSTRVDPQIVSKIRRLASEGNKPFKEKAGRFVWTLTLAIPFGIFFRHEISDPAGRRFRANFYKCGDKLSVPHFVTWSPVGTQQPDYHQPPYFGELKFL
jgi:hypothetical protein